MEPKVLRNTSRDTEREHLNKILKDLSGQITAVQTRIDNLPSGGSPEVSFGFSFSVDPTNFSLDNPEENAFYLDIIPGGIGTNELADDAVTTDKILDEAVTGDKIDFSTFDTDDVVEGTTNLYFTTERAQDAVGNILDSGTFVDLSYNDGTPSILADLSATGVPSSSTVLRGNNVWGTTVDSVSAGTGISVDLTDPSDPVIHNEGVLSVSAGTGVTVDNTDPQNPVVSSTGGTGIVETIVAGDGISVDSTDPANPIINNEGVITVSAGVGIVVNDGDPQNISIDNEGVLSVVAGDAIDVDVTDPANPIVSFVTPGSDTEVLFNDGGVVGAEPVFILNKTLARLDLGTLTTPTQKDGGYTTSFPGASTEAGMDSRVFDTAGGVNYLRFFVQGDSTFHEVFLEDDGTFSYDGLTIWHAGNLLNIGTSAGSARTALALGTAATINTGTSGGTLGLLNTNNTESGNNTHTGSNTYSGAVFETGVISPTALAGNTDNWAPTGFSTCNVIRMDSSGAFNLNGLAGGAAGRRITLVNISGSIISIIGGAGTSTAANRFSVSKSIPAGAMIELWYDGITSRWRVSA